MTGVAAAPFLGKPGEAGMQNGSNDGAHDWRSQVQPCIGEIAGGYHQAKRPRWVEGSAVEGASHEDIEGQRHADRQRARLPARPATAVLRTTVTRKKASTASIRRHPDHGRGARTDEYERAGADEFRKELWLQTGWISLAPQMRSTALGTIR
jgi:hypothetical protein